MPTLIRWREETLKRPMQSYRCAKILSQSSTTESQTRALILATIAVMLFQANELCQGYGRSVSCCVVDRLN